jgi:hypothetical protein
MGHHFLHQTQSFAENGSKKPEQNCKFLHTYIAAKKRQSKQGKCHLNANFGVDFAFVLHM